MDILGYIAAIVIGISLGLIGGGGSILTVPVLVYLLGISPVLATAYSLFVVGSASLVGAFNNLKKGLVSVKTAIIFAIPSFLTVYATRLWVVPSIPDQLVTIGTFDLTKDIAIMVFFAAIMLAAAVSMIRNKRKDVADESETKELKFNYPMIVLEGVVVGFLTGIVGAGGGFLIIPALVLLARLTNEAGRRNIALYHFDQVDNRIYGRSSSRAGNRLAFPIDFQRTSDCWDFCWRTSIQLYSRSKTQKRLRLVRTHHGRIHHIERTFIEKKFTRNYEHTSQCIDYWRRNCRYHDSSSTAKKR